MRPGCGRLGPPHRPPSAGCLPLRGRQRSAPGLGLFGAPGLDLFGAPGLGLFGAPGLGLFVALGTLCACTEVRQRLLPVPVPLTHPAGGALYGSGAAMPTPQAQCDDSSIPAGPGGKVLIDLGTPISAARTPGGQDVFTPTGQVFLNAPDGSRRQQLCNMPLFQTGQSPQEFTLTWGAAQLTPDVVVGGNLLAQRFSLSLSFGREPSEPLCTAPPCMRLAGSDIADGCQLSARGEAVLPFTPAGGDVSPTQTDDVVRIQLGDNIFEYPATRITLPACLEPLGDPLQAAQPTACIPSNRVLQAQIDVAKAIDSAEGQSPANCDDVCALRADDQQLCRLLHLLPDQPMPITLAPTCIPEVPVQRLRCDQPADGDVHHPYETPQMCARTPSKVCQCPAGLPDIEDTIERRGLRDPHYAPSGLDVNLLVSTGLPGVLLSQTAFDHLRGAGAFTALSADATSHVKLQYPGLPQEDAYRTTLGRSDTLALALVSRERFLSPCQELARNRRQRYGLPWYAADQDLLCQDCLATMCLIDDTRDPTQRPRRCAYSGPDQSHIELSCDDFSAPVAAVIEMQDPLEVFVVPDSEALLQAANADVRNATPRIDGILGVAALERLQVELDLASGRVIGHCGCDRTAQSCLTYARITDQTAEGSCPELQREQIYLAQKPAPGQSGAVPPAACFTR